ncbi:formimidoylglutamate deiminase [Tistrella bauzanensis]|uniref:Formimidoylglutamate deiminase n=1 Tax=Tistrella bauzanensis TaxID=657419 RepID=A0ABQ1ISY3_9PROT|nr:formimidoylglutamate deiminase [Tistrella bauzanensis]GGB51708.1 formimidoylglutamate deiminase [Tistrella bauzanensis]
MRRLFLKHALLPDGWAHDVSLTIDGRGRIAAIGTGDAAAAAGADLVLTGHAVPGMPDLHGHAHQRAIAGFGERAGRDGGDSFWSWRSAMYAALDRMTPDDFQAVASQLYVEMLKAGFTAIGEFHYLHHDIDGRPYADPAEMSLRAIAAARETGIALAMLPVLYAAGGFAGKPPGHGQRRFILDSDRFLALVSRLDALASGDDDLVVGIAPHSLRAVPADLLARVLATRPQGPVHIHIAEQPQEVADCLAATGRRPVDVLFDQAGVDERWCLVHATHITDAERGRIVASGAVAGLCPTTEANLGDGLFPAEAFMAEGGRIGIGSDSHISVSPVEELRLLEYGQRLISGRRTVLAGGPGRATGQHLHTAAARGGAQALGLDAGAIAIGLRADIVVLDADDPLMVARRGDGILDGWIFAGNRPLVRDVLVGGRQVVANGRHAHEDLIARRFRATLERLHA